MKTMTIQQATDHLRELEGHIFWLRVRGVSYQPDEATLATLWFVGERPVFITLLNSNQEPQSWYHLPDVLHYQLAASPEFMAKTPARSRLAVSIQEAATEATTAT
jgi:hypothetical protein